MRRKSILLMALMVFLSSCSPAYVLEAGWEEAKILFRRKEIARMVESPSTDNALRDKLSLVLKAREYTKALGLEPKGSYSMYSEVDRDVLVWVISASSKTSLSPVTWWFPIVGRVPYLGFFDKEDAIDEFKRLSKKGFDVYLRPSPAFSTLGWFDDPLLSTVAKFDDLSLVGTIVHEVLHNTVWIPNHVSFNETLANYVGMIGAGYFFRDKNGPDNSLAIEAEDRLYDEILFARFIDDTARELQDLYGSDKSLEQILVTRENIFQRTIHQWKSQKPLLRTTHYNIKNLKLNNAFIIAQRLYLDRIWLFDEAFRRCKCQLKDFILKMKEIQNRVQDKESDPYKKLQNLGQSPVSYLGLELPPI